MIINNDMKLYHPINLKCWDLISRLTIEHTKHFPETFSNFANIKHFISESDRDVINTELRESGLPNYRELLAYKRVQPKSVCLDSLHVDPFVPIAGEINKITIIFPVENCRGTAQMWYGGNYSLFEKRYGPRKDYITFGVNGHGELNYLGEVEICDQPMIVRTDVPHTVYSTDKYRLVCTLRFSENIDMNYIVSRLQNKHNTLPQ